MDREATYLLVEKFGQKYSDILGIKLKTKSDGEVFKWFLASVLFGAPINETSAIRTYKCFESHEILAPRKILETGWDGLVKILDEGGYTRYDFKTSDKLLEVMGNLVTRYGGSLNLVHEKALDPYDLENRLKELGKGVGNVTVSIFLRELRGLWRKVDSKPTSLIILAANNLGVVREGSPEKVLEELKEFWRKNGVDGKTFVNFETALLRLGKNLCRKKKCGQCVVQRYCQAIASD